MKLIAIILLYGSLSIPAFATDGINFVKNMTWTQVKAKALKEKKMIFLDAYATWCGPCKYMDESVYAQKETADFFNANFINVKIDMETVEGSSLSNEFEVTAYPTFLFLSAEGKLLHKYIGALETSKFVLLGKDAVQPSKQYFTLKAKAAKLELSDVDFSYWASAANDLTDPEREDILRHYFISKKDILATKDMATILLYYTPVTDEQLIYLYKKQARIMELMGWDDSKTKSVLYELVFSKAVDAYEATNFSLDSFLTVVKRFDPSAVNFAEKDLGFKKAIIVDQDADKAVGLLISYLKDVKDPLDIKFIATWIIDNSQKFSMANMVTLSKELEQFNLRPIDKNNEYWLYLAQMLVYAKADEDAKAKEAAMKALQHPLLPKEYADVLKESYDLKK
jgi:thiol-disulfide isomerase/thioredoxin